MTYSSLVTPLGNDVSSNFEALLAGQSGISCHLGVGIQQEDLYLSLFHDRSISTYNSLLALAIEEAISRFPEIDFSSEKTGFIISSTKGNLEDLHTNVFSSTRTIIREKSKNTHPVIILSNACISGVSAINVAANAVRNSIFEQVLVIGIDMVWDFVKFGFQSLYAMSSTPVQPFDINRKGVNLGEAMASILVSSKIKNVNSCIYLSGSNSNDANHISGPSRTGEGLVRTIQQTLDRARLASSEIDFISGHGTGTLFNDEMEAIAFNRTHLSQTPIHSLKGYFGHTLGAAGVLETNIALAMVEHQTLVPCLGYMEMGTSVPLSIVQEVSPSKIETVLKTASGFGGGNASLLFQKAK